MLLDVTVKLQQPGSHNLIKHNVTGRRRYKNSSPGPGDLCWHCDGHPAQTCAGRNMPRYAGTRACTAQRQCPHHPASPHPGTLWPS